MAKMTKRDQMRKELYQIADVHGLETKGFHEMAEAARVMRATCTTLQRLGELRCNGVMRRDPDGRGPFASWNDDDEADADMREGLALKRLEAALAAAFVTPPKVQHQPDPRGAPIILIVDGREWRFA